MHPDDLVGGLTECVVDDGPPKDIYDPIPPAVEVVDPTSTAPETTIVATDTDNTGFEDVNFAIDATDNIAVADVICTSPTTAITFVSETGDRFAFTGVFPVGTTGVTCTATDVRANPAPNSAVVEFLVTVKDVTPPSFAVAPGPDAGAPYGPGNPAEATGPNGAVVTYTNPSATDNGGGPVTVDCASSNGSLRSGSLFPVGTTPIDCVATDASSNSIEVDNMFAITVRDTAPPVLGAVSNITATATGAAGAIVSYPTPTVTDAMGATVSCVPPSGSTFPVGTSTVLCTATDAAGNIATKSFTVTVNSVVVAITAVANPNTLLWSPNKTMTPVTVSGVATGSGLVSITYTVVDEYNKVKPTGASTAGAGGNYSFVVSLEAYRNGNDSDGRLYTITVTGVWTGGRTASATTTVRVPHNQ